MIEFEAFKTLIAEIESQGFDRETAGRYAVLIGDTPCYDEDGSLLVIEAANVIATLKPLDFFDGNSEEIVDRFYTGG